jgi:UDP-GlcNAc:undecaprenyl-phosphate/decaprenyl-phosphate GlcNAc-1-phosphate transferase
MTTVLFIFVLSLIFSLFFTPLIITVGKKYNLVDQPSARKIHKTAIPRIGGVAIFISFFLPFLTVLFYSNDILKLLVLDHARIALIIGASIAFGLGLGDDIKRLNPWLKFGVQALVGCVAFWGGIRIDVISLPMVGPLQLGWLSLPVTVFWFLLVINAINLIDGLDGLAAGISFFAAIVLLVLCIASHSYLVAMGLAALSGATLGFLRYNFNPASIFMGDSGSYFLGYMLAALSIQGSIKSQATVVTLMPLIALGLPLMDTLWATIRRFILGQGVFAPDKDHLHHRLIKHGFTHRRAVLILYGVTVGMGGIALILVHSSDERAALILLLIGAGLVFFIRKLGYLEYLAAEKFLGWARDITDEMGIKRERRTFLGLQVTIAESKTLAEFWEKVIDAGQFLDFDYLELRLENGSVGSWTPTVLSWKADGRDFDGDHFDRKRVLYLTLPLAGEKHKIGSLALAKDLNGSSLRPHILRRIEHLRRTVEGTIRKLSIDNSLVVVTSPNNLASPPRLSSSRSTSA